MAQRIFKSPLELVDSYISEPLQKNTSEKDAQRLANDKNRVVRYQEEGNFGPTRTNLNPGKTGIKFPEGTKFKPKSWQDGIETKYDDRFPGPNPAVIVSHPKYGKATIQGARDFDHAKQIYIDAIKDEDVEKYGLDPDQVIELKQKFKGKDYKEAIKRLKGGEAFGDILNGLVTYEK